jgi:three-Cys-motif partner protein
MPAEDRAPKGWRYKEQTRMKHAVLSNYLARWGSILRKPWSRGHQILSYADTFAGRGRYEGGEPGSPLRAMEVGQDLHDHFHWEVFFARKRTPPRRRRRRQAQEEGLEGACAAVDTLGHLLALHLTPASEQDRAQVEELAEAVQEEATGESVELAYDVEQGFTGEEPAEAAEEG